MSTGGIIGSIVGGVVGFFIGGPMGAIYGASIGFGVGMMVDPLTPDAPVAGSPLPGQATMKSTTGDPCADLCGTAKITGHLLNYGAERSVAVYSEASSSSSGGKGGPPEPQPQVIGYEYFMSWQLGICRGPIDTLYAIYKNGELAWEGPLDLPISGGKETITIDGFGSIDFYFGTDDQTANSALGALLDDATLNSPLRHYCWAFMNDCKIGEYPRTPTLEFVIKKIPDISYGLSLPVQDYDSQPMAAVYYALNELSGLPEDWFDEDDFNEVDSTLRTEYRGISVLFQEYHSAMTYIQSILDHISCVMRYGTDGKFHPKLIRDDYDVDNLPVIDEDDLLDDIDFDRKSWIDTKNEIKVQYTEIFNVERTKQVLFSNIWGAGYNGNFRMSDAFNISSRYYSFTQGNTSHPFYTKSWEKVKAFGVLMAVDENGALWTGGSNWYGETGKNSTNSTEEFELNVAMDGKKIVYIGPNYTTSCCIDINGHLYTAGWNRYANLGLYGITSAAEVASYTRVQQSGAGGYSFPNYWIAASFSFEFGQAIGADGVMYSVGGQASNFAALGWGLSPPVPRNRNYFMPVPSTPYVSVINGNWVDVKTRSNEQTWGQKSNGSVYFTGINQNGLFGDPSIPIASNVYEFQEIGNGFKHWHVDSDGGIFIGVALDGTLWGSGNNNDSALGLGASAVGNVNTLSRLDSDNIFEKAYAINSGCCIALKSDGTVWAAGSPGYYNTGTGLPTGVYYTWTQVDLSGETFEDIISGLGFTLGFAAKY